MTPTQVPNRGELPHPSKLAPVSDSNIIITGRLSFWGNYFRPTPVSLWWSDLGPMGVSDHCYTRSDDLLAIGAMGSMLTPGQAPGVDILFMEHF